jgi:hypothetical protein
MAREFKDGEKFLLSDTVLIVTSFLAPGFFYWYILNKQAASVLPRKTHRECQEQSVFEAPSEEEDRWQVQRRAGE